MSPRIVHPITPARRPRCSFVILVQTTSSGGLLGSTFGRAHDLLETPRDGSSVAREGKKGREKGEGERLHVPHAPHRNDGRALWCLTSSS